jgi:hypothetical protein
VRTAVTLLDSFRYYRDAEFYTSEAEDRSLAELILRIRGERTPQTDVMLRGIAWHDVCEHPDETYDANTDTYASQGYEFEAASAGAILMDLPPDRVCEVKMVETIGPLQVSGIADYLDGVVGGDMKLSKKVEPDKYFESVQWKAYCHLADLEMFRYHVAQPRERKGIVSLHDYKVFTFYRDEKTDRDVEELCEHFYEFAQPYLKKENAA